MDTSLALQDVIVEVDDELATPENLMVVVPKNVPGMTVVDDNGFQSDIFSMRDQLPRS